MNKNTEIEQLLRLLIYDIAWLSTKADRKSDQESLQRMSKIVGEISHALDGETINAKETASLLYSKDIQFGLLDLTKIEQED